MPNTKKKWHKNHLVIDLRALQDFKHNGVTKSSYYWINELIKQSKSDEPITLWTNSKDHKELPQHWLTKKNVNHIHTCYGNFILSILWYLNLGPKLSKILKLNSKFILFSPDIRPRPHDNYLKTIQYFHDIAFLKFPNQFSLKSRLLFFLSKPKKLFFESDLILTNSKFTKSELTNHFNESKKIKIIHPTLPKKLPTKTTKLPFQNYYLSISTIQKRKDFKSLIQKFTNSNQNLLIIGQVDATFTKTKLQKSNNIKILSNISDKEKHFLIRNSIATIYPSNYEGFGLPILESIRLKKEVYCKAIPPFKSLFKNQTTDLSQLFKIKPKEISKPNLFPLKKEIRKLKRNIYNLD